MTPDLLATERLRLHRPTLHDLAPIHALRAEESSLEEARAELAEWIAHWDEHGFGYWVIRNDAGEFVGIGGIARKRLANGELANLWYEIAPRARHNGYATEVTRAALQAAFGPLDLDRVHAIVHPDNADSIAVAEGAGMAPAGALAPEGLLLYVADRTTWRSEQPVVGV